MYIEEIKRGLRGEIKKRENEQYFTCETNIRQMCKDVLAKIEEQESVIADKDNEIRLHKYKRCLDNAWWCLREEFFAEDCHCEHWVDWAIKWYKRWLAIAEKFKETK